MRFLIRLAALLLIIFGIWLARDTWRFTETAITTTATVEYVGASDYGLGDKALLHFTDEKRSKRVAKIPFVISEQPLIEKHQIEIIYDPRNPSRAQINNVYSIWFLSVAAIVFGIVIRTIVRPKRRVRTIQSRSGGENVREVKSSTTYVQLPSRESTADHARETVSSPTVWRRRP